MLWKLADLARPGPPRPPCLAPCKVTLAVPSVVYREAPQLWTRGKGAHVHAAPGLALQVPAVSFLPPAGRRGWLRADPGLSPWTATAPAPSWASASSRPISNRVPEVTPARAPSAAPLAPPQLSGALAGPHRSSAGERAEAEAAHRRLRLRWNQSSTHSVFHLPRRVPQHDHPESQVLTQQSGPASHPASWAPTPVRAVPSPRAGAPPPAGCWLSSPDAAPQPPLGPRAQLLHLDTADTLGPMSPSQGPPWAPQGVNTLHPRPLPTGCQEHPSSSCKHQTCADTAEGPREAVTAPADPEEHSPEVGSGPRSRPGAVRAGRSRLLGAQRGRARGRVCVGASPRPGGIPTSRGGTAPMKAVPHAR
ncbi:hypothetical protein VULLAG_LOCUS9786 [Vulpes lagopus]